MSKIENYLNQLGEELSVLNSFIHSEIGRLNSILPTTGDQFLSTDDCMLIVYADQFQSNDGKTPLQNLKLFLENELEGEINHVHILPFFPWTSDDGFSPTDYKKVCSKNGSWEDIENLSSRTMFDCVFNHLSSQSTLFQKALEGEEQYKKQFHIVDHATYTNPSFQKNIEKVVRPRTSPLFSKYNIDGEPNYVWTTFSSDQIDTNFSNPEMLKYILESFFLYLEKKATYFRIDAVPFLWKEFGTNCSHLEKTHTIVKLLRAIADQVNGNIIIVTESNVPHSENISYWGDADEAHLVYNFSLSPLILYSLFKQSNEAIHPWINSVLQEIPKTCSFLNFTATHDGIGMRGLEGLVAEEEIYELVSLAQRQGGQIGWKKSRDGTKRPYELNCTWRSILDSDELNDLELKRKVINSQSIVLFFPGITGHYVHNFFGTENDQQGYIESKIARRLNRKKLSYPPNPSEFTQPMLNWVRCKKNMHTSLPSASILSVQTDSRLLFLKKRLDDIEHWILFNLSSKDLQLNMEQREFKLMPYEMLVWDNTRSEIIHRY
ncbi:MAG: alpha-amylase family glycosyl hydrolase [Bdellovibrionales bacterium]